MGWEARGWEEIEPGRCKHLQLPFALSLSVCVLDAPSHFEATRPFAAILVPRGQELDWVFCAPNGVWDLLFSASVSRLVVLRRLTQQHEAEDEEEEEEEQAEELCVLPHFQGNLRRKDLACTSQAYHVCIDDVDVGTHNSNEEEEHQHQHAKENQSDLCTYPHFQPRLRLTQHCATLNSKENETEQEEHEQVQEEQDGQQPHLCTHPRSLRAKGVSGTSQSYPLCTDHVNVDDNGDDVSFKNSVAPLLHSLFPWNICPCGPAPDPYVTYEDHVQTRLVVEKRHSEALSGDILVEDVELDCNLHDGTSIFGMESNKCRHILRRRMRFQQMPNLIQTEVPIAIYKSGQLTSRHGLEDVKAAQEKLACNHSLENGSSGKVGEVSQVNLEVRLDHSKLVHKYLPPIVAGLVLASPCLEACIAANTRARFLAIGLGGGALSVFLHKQFGFSVLAVDTDEIVVDLARRHFGLVDNEHLQVQVKDGMDMIFSIAHQACKNNFVSIEMSKDWQAACKDSAQELCQGKILSAFECADARMHVIVVDVNVADALSGLLAPPPCFLSKAFLLGVRMALHEGGMLVINVIPRTKHKLNLVVNSLRKVFSGIYQIQIEDNHVLFAFPSKIADINMSCDFALSVAHAIGDDLFDKIEEIEESVDD